jgi:adenylate cyclase
MSNICFISGHNAHNGYSTVSFSDVLNKDFDPEYFKGKIVLFGPYTVGLTDDRFITAIDHQEPLYGIEVHANIIQNILSNKFKQEVPDTVNLMILILFAFAGPFIFKKLGPMISALTLAVLMAVYTWTATIVYNWGFIIQLLYPVSLVVVIYLTMLVYRYIEELLERKRVTDVFGRYVAPQVVSSILKGGEEGLKLGGTRREITALFVDIRGFTPLSEKCQPEEVVEILNDYLHLCATSIFEFGGTLDKFIGDATMAIFNAPLNLDDHEFRAVQAAWAMKQGSYALAEKLEKKFGRSVEFGIGINTGFAVVGNIGAKFRMDYTAIGDTVNTAARLESNSKPGQILLSWSTYERVRDRVEASFLGEIKVKGKELGLPVYQLDGIKAVDS